MRLPNGFGSISKLPGKRRNPWRARKSTIINGKQEYTNIGYYHTRQEALIALTEYNTNPYDVAVNTITFSEVYEKWSERKFNEISISSANGYKAAYKHCTPLYDMKFKDIKLMHMQAVADTLKAKQRTAQQVKVLLNQLFDYAVQYEIIGRDKHVVEYLNVGKKEKSTRHYRFNENELKTLWNNAETNEYIKLILMMIYSGTRPGELIGIKKSNINLEEQYINVEKGKTSNAIRKVPIHNKILSFFEYWMHKNNSEYLITGRDDKPIIFLNNSGYFTEMYWNGLLSDIGILEYTNEQGEKQIHVPYDTRHTFTTMWKEKKLDEAIRRKVQGHSGSGIGEQVYTHFDFEILLNEVNKL